MGVNLSRFDLVGCEDTIDKLVHVYKGTLVQLMEYSITSVTLIAAHCK